MWNDRRGYNDDRAPKVEPPLGVFMVRLQNPQGSAGTSTAQTAYTYDVYLLDNKTQISTSTTTVIGSPCRVVNCACTHPATYGLAFYGSGNSNALTIAFAFDEFATQNNCS
jgi:hypothetical protein